MILHYSREMLNDDSFSVENKAVRSLARYPRQTDSGITVDEGRICVSRFVLIRYSPNDSRSFFAFTETIYGRIAPSRAINGIIRWSTCTIVRFPEVHFALSRSHLDRLGESSLLLANLRVVASLSGLAESYLKRPFANARVLRERLECDCEYLSNESKFYSRILLSLLSQRGLGYFLPAVSDNPTTRQLVHDLLTDLKHKRPN